jgi:hypothetical protein
VCVCLVVVGAGTHGMDRRQAGRGDGLAINQIRVARGPLPCRGLPAVSAQGHRDPPLLRRMENGLVRQVGKSADFG